ncbi:MAG TPA: trans-aconitate 2-methyltransferase [Bauldia sp.]|nr:trans-aconitate 2-methyltransferase [Bauldia sp.]
MDTWSPAQYLKFEDERTRPALDLLSHVPATEVATAVDIGCGPGNSTELIAARFPSARITGIDTSPEMLTAARKRLPAVSFAEADVATWMPDTPVGLLFGNAVFQWVPDHLAVLARLVGGLAPGGVLAMQVPDNLDEPSHALMREVAARPFFAAKFATPIARDPIPSVGAYYDRLKPLMARVDIWRTTYHHVLAGPAEIVEWVKATGLRPYLDRLDSAERAAYLAAYQAAIAKAYPAQVDGRVIFPFPRLFIVALRA